MVSFFLYDFGRALWSDLQALARSSTRLTTAGTVAGPARAASQRTAHCFDNGRTDGDAVGRRGHDRGARCVFDAESDSDRQGRVTFDSGNRSTDRLGVGRRRPRHPSDGNVIDESAGVREHGGKANIIGRRSRQSDERQSCFQGRLAELIVLLRRAVDDDEPVDSRGQRVAEKRPDAINVDRIEIAHEDERRVWVPRAKRSDHLECRTQRLPSLQSALTGGLYGRTVRHRIRERHAEFDHVRSGCWKSTQDVERRARVGISRHDISDERRSALGGKPLEAAVDA